MKWLHQAFIAVLLALCTFGWASEARAAAPGGDPFCTDGPSNGVLAQRIEAALAQDPSGLRVKPKNCNAVPASFLVAYQEVDKNEKNLKTVADLPAYFRKLVAETAEKKVLYQTSVLYVSRNGDQHVALGRETREAKIGEVIYVNPDTGAKVAMGACSNPGVEKIEDVVVIAENCYRIDFPSMSAGKSRNLRMAIRYAHMDSKAIKSDGCLSWLYAGEVQKRYETTEECPSTYRREVRDGNRTRMATVVCRWDEVEAAASRALGRRVVVQNVSGSFYARQDGTNSWWVPESALDGMAVICWEDEDGNLRASVGVTRKDFVNKVATILPQHVRDADKAY